jgi:Zn-dependent protease
MDFSAGQILQVLVAAVALVFSVVFHENAHGVAAEHFGDTTARDLGRITMNPLPHIDPVGTVLIPALGILSGIPIVGWAKPVPVNPANFRNPVVDDAYVAAAGPASNFLLAAGGTVLLIVVRVVFKHVPALQENSGNTFLFFQLLCVNLIQINCVLGIFNLIPIPPLDGHWVLARYLPSKWAGMLAAIRPYGFFILIMLLWTGALGWIIKFPVEYIAGGLFRVVQYAASVL